MRDHTPETLKRARRLRREMSLPERLLWTKLRNSPDGLKFRRQHPVGEWVVDFYCDRAKAVIEVDGIAHDMGNRPEGDAARDAALAARGLRTIRISATEVLRDYHTAAEIIFRNCRDVPPPSAANAAATSPGGGGVEGGRFQLNSSPTGGGGPPPTGGGGGGT